MVLRSCLVAFYPTFPLIFSFMARLSFSLYFFCNYRQPRRCRDKKSSRLRPPQGQYLHRRYRVRHHPMWVWDFLIRLVQSVMLVYQFLCDLKLFVYRLEPHLYLSQMLYDPLRVSYQSVYVSQMLLQFLQGLLHYPLYRSHVLRTSKNLLLSVKKPYCDPFWFSSQFSFQLATWMRNALPRLNSFSYLLDWLVYLFRQLGQVSRLIVRVQLLYFLRLFKDVLSLLQLFCLRDNRKLLCKVSLLFWLGMSFRFYLLLNFVESFVDSFSLLVFVRVRECLSYDEF